VNTTSLAKIFFDVLRVTVVNSSFIYYRDAFLFDLMLNWGLEVQFFDLQPEQSAFALCQRLAVATGTLPMSLDAPQQATEAGNSPAKPRYDELSLKAAKLIKKRTGATRWTQKLAKALERYLHGLRELPDDDQGPNSPALEMQAALADELVADVWHTILECDDPGNQALKAADKQRRKRDKARQEKAREKGERKELTVLQKQIL
jgi:hypothetical protein